MKKYWLLAFIIVAAGGLYWIVSQRMERSRLAHDRAASICYVYKYDKQNPSVHATLGSEFHQGEWLNYEKAFGPSGAKDIDDFCRTH